MMDSPRWLCRRRWRHEAIVPHDPRCGMRSMPQFPQLRQIRASYSSAHRLSARKNEMLHVGSLRAVQPLREFTFAEAPLPPDLDCRDFLALGPQAYRPGRDSEPFG